MSTTHFNELTITPFYIYYEVKHRFYILNLDT